MLTIKLLRPGKDVNIINLTTNRNKLPPTFTTTYPTFNAS
jgi:hypothetical protein